MALTQNVAEQLAMAYDRGDIDQLNNILIGNGVSSRDVASFFNFDASTMSDLGASGIKFATVDNSAALREAEEARRQAEAEAAAQAAAEREAAAAAQRRRRT